MPRDRGTEQLGNHSEAALQDEIAKRDRDAMVLEHMSLVERIAWGIHLKLPGNILLEDVVHSGVVGLLDAIDKYDPRRQVPFSTYAGFRIRGEILDSLRHLDWGSRELRRKARQLEQTRNSLGMRLSHVPDETELAYELGMPLDKFRSLVARLHSLQISNFADGQALEHVECRRPQENPFIRSRQTELRQLLQHVIADLPDKERCVLQLHYFEELTLAEVGSVLGLAERTAGYIHSIAVKHVRSRFAKLTAAERVISTARVPGPQSARV